MGPFREKEFFIEEYVNKRRSALSIANELGVGETTVFRWLELYGIKRRNSSENQNPLYGKEPSKEELVELHYNQHKSINSLAKEFNTSWGNVQRLFKKYSLRTKTHYEMIMPKDFVKPSKEELIRLLDEGFDTKEIGLKYCVNRTTVVNWIHEGGISLSKIKRVRVSYNKVWNKDKILFQIKDIWYNHGDLSARFCRLNRKSLYNAGVSYFGSWAKAIQAAGIAYYDKIAINKNKYWTKDNILDKIKEIYKSEGNISSRYTRMKHSDLYDAAKVKFSSWKSAITLAGFDYNDFNRKYKYLCQDENRVMSIYEMDVANFLYFNGVSYEYEPSISKKRKFRADFKVGKFFIEIPGLLAIEDYKKNFEEKTTNFMMEYGTGSAVFKGENYELYKELLDKENKDVIVIVEPKNNTLSRKEINRQLGFLVPLFSKNQKTLLI
mgnify:CR=1 FL=1